MTVVSNHVWFSCTKQAPATCDVDDETVETISHSRGGAVNVSSSPDWRAESDPGAAAFGIDRGNGDDPLAVLSGREANHFGKLGVAPRDSMGLEGGSEPTPGA